VHLLRGRPRLLLRRHLARFDLLQDVVPLLAEFLPLQVESQLVQSQIVLRVIAAVAFDAMLLEEWLEKLLVRRFRRRRS
jgi:hypothetical protein